MCTIQHHLPTSRKLSSTKKWLTLVYILKSEQVVLPIPISKTMIPKALQEATVLHHNTVVTIKNLTTITFFNIQTDTECHYTNILAFTRKLDVFVFVMGPDIYVLDHDVLKKIYTLPFPIELKGSQMDVVYNPQTSNHIFLFSKNKEVLTIQSKNNRCKCVKFHKRMNDLKWTFWLCDQDGGFFGSNFSLMYSSVTDSLFECVETIIKIDYLYNVDRWLVQLFGDCLVLDFEGMQIFLHGKNSLELISAIDCSKLIHCAHISTTSTEIHATRDHSIIMYEYKNRLCLAQTTYPFKIFPNIKIQKPPHSFDPLLKIHYDEKNGFIKLFCMHTIYTFNLLANSFTDSTRIETTLE
jgi:hypothetical protein